MKNWDPHGDEEQRCWYDIYNLYCHLDNTNSTVTRAWIYDTYNNLPRRCPRDKFSFERLQSVNKDKNKNKDNDTKDEVDRLKLLMTKSDIVTQEKDRIRKDLIRNLPRYVRLTNRVIDKDTKDFFLSSSFTGLCIALITGSPGTGFFYVSVLNVGRQVALKVFW